MYSVVPTAACELKTHSLKLSREALLELQNIEKLMAGSDDTEYVGNRCEAFFSTYGSHISAGILHFGGVNKFIATYASEIRSNSDTVKSMLTDALNAYASASYSGLGFSVGGCISADHMGTHATGSFSANYEKSEQQKTTLKTSRNGGPHEVTGLPLWKMGLVTRNSTWALIDREANCLHVL